MKELKEVQRETAEIFRDKIKLAGLDELHAIEKRLVRHYNAGTLNQADFTKLDMMCFNRIARFGYIPVKEIEK